MEEQGLPRIVVKVRNDILKVVAGTMEYHSPSVSYEADLQGVLSWFEKETGAATGPAVEEIRHQLQAIWYRRATEKQPEAKQKEKESACSEYVGRKFYAEQVFRPDTGQPEFLVYDHAKEKVRFESELKAEGVRVVPLKYDEKERNAVWLPDGAEEYGSLAALRSKIKAWALKEYDPMGNVEQFELFQSHGILSWLPELQQASPERFHPIFRTMGSSESGKKRYLTVARYIFRRPFFARKSNRVPSIFRGADKWSGITRTGSTLILEEADVKRGDYDSELLQFLNGRTDGTPEPRFDAEKGEMDFIHSEGYTVIAARFPTTDTGFETRCITQPAVATDRPEAYDLIPPPKWDEEGRSIMRQLLMFRLRNRTKQFKIPTNLLIDGVGPRVRLTLMLLQPLTDQDPDIVKDYVEMGRRLEARLREARSASNEGLVLNLVYSSIEQDPERKAISNVEYEGNLPYFTVRRPKEEEDEYELLRQPLTASYVAQKIGNKGLSARDVNMIWRGLGQSTKPNMRYSQVVGEGRDEKTVSTTSRGVLLVSDAKRLAREFRRFVPDCSVALVALVADTCTRQAILGGG